VESMLVTVVSGEYASYCNEWRMCSYCSEWRVC
jgi:hypothetical protein